MAGSRGVPRTSPPGTRAPRIEWRRVDGVLLLDKPLGLTSNAALQRVRRLYRAERAGHSGTLDPLATGLLPVLFGEATKFGAEMLAADKRYRATIALGARDGRLAEATGLEAAAVALTGLRQPLALARHDTVTGPTWLAMVGIRDREAVTIEIRARAPAAGPEIKARFTRTFHLE